jgi:SAM-dependent methyltransferase
MSTASREDRKKILFDNLLAWFNNAINLDTSNMTVMEFGCGRFGYISLYKEYFKGAIALDIDDYSDSYSQDIKFVVSDGFNIPLPNNSVDVVVCHSVLEHVVDLEKSLSEIHRILKIGGYAYLTISPLYFSPGGSHINHPIKLDKWEHLDPESPYYMTQNPMPSANWAGLYLNKLTVGEFLHAVGNIPWNIMAFDRRILIKEKPEFLQKVDGINPLNLFTREFRFLGKKLCDIGENGAIYK